MVASSQGRSGAHPFIRKLQQMFPLSLEEQHAIVHGPVREVRLSADDQIAREGHRPQHCTLLLDGFAYRYKMLRDGKQQILSFQIPGDFCDIQSFVVDRMDHGVATITPCRIAIYSHKTILELVERFPSIARALWKETLIDAAVYREWMTSIGRRTAYERIAHLLCEMVVRLRAIDLCDGDNYPFPVTQTQIGDALGLSTVHVNRTLQQMRSDGLIAFKGGTVSILSWERLKSSGEFTADYLELPERDFRVMVAG